MMRGPKKRLVKSWSSLVEPQTLRGLIPPHRAVAQQSADKTVPVVGDHRKADAPAPWPDRAGACRAIAETLNHRNDLPMVDSLRGKAARSLKNQNSIFLA